MDGLLDACMNEQTVGLKGGWAMGRSLDACMNEQMVGGRGGWLMDGRTDGQVDG